MLPLSFPWILISLLMISIGLLLWKKRIAACISLLLAICLNWWAECIPFRLWPVNGAGDGQTIKVMSFNISGTSADIHPKVSTLVSLIKRYDPDLIFIAEISNKNKPVLDSLMQPTYSYTAFTTHYAHCFYSKREVQEWRKLKDENAEHLGVYICMLPVDGDTIAFYGCHFASNNYNAKQQYITPDSINSRRDLKTYISDVERAYRLRADEAIILADEVKKTKNPVIVMGDMNDVGGSVSIRTLEKTGLEDAWWNGGLVYGATIHHPLPYRIDHIMYSNELKLTKIKVVESEGLSDHDALYAEFKIKNNIGIK